MEEKEEPELQLWAESIISGRTREPLVQMRLGDKPIGQFSPNAARQYAGQLLEAAEAAESDAFVFNWLTRDIIGTSEDEQANWDRIIGEFRAFREARLNTDPWKANATPMPKKD